MSCAKLVQMISDAFVGPSCDGTPPGATTCVVDSGGSDWPLLVPAGAMLGKALPNSKLMQVGFGLVTLVVLVVDALFAWFSLRWRDLDFQLGGSEKNSQMVDPGSRRER